MKKNNKKSASAILGIPDQVEEIVEKKTYNDDFFPKVLTPTKGTREVLSDISHKIKVRESVNAGEILKMVDPIAEVIQSTGNYRRAMKRDGDVEIDGLRILEFIGAYCNMNREAMKSSTLENFDKTAKKIIRIAKSYYEYSGGIEFIPDDKYDMLLAAYLAAGATEPSGIAPKGQKNLSKVGIKYHTLHNNMDKSYRVYDTDPIPDGVKEKDSIEKFLQRALSAIDAPSEREIEVEISPKLDGCSINGTIKGKEFLDPQTRGDMEESVSVPGLMNRVVTDMENDKEFGIQYEAFVTEQNRLRASEYLRMAEPYRSCRHAAAGILHRLYSGEDEKLSSFLSFYPIMAEDLEGTYGEVVDYVQNFGSVPKDMIPRKIIKGNLKGLLRKIESEFHRFEEKRPNLSYPIDGMVITIVDDDYQKAIGRDGRTNKYQIALKFDPSSGTSHVKGIWLDTGRKGYRTIQVDLTDPVYIDGVRYDHVPVLSVDLFEDMNLREGSEVSVSRTGDVIPAIHVTNEGSGKKIKLPTTCECGHDLTIKAKKLYCSNPMCSTNIVGRLTDFFQKIGMDDYGESFAELLHEKLDVSSISDLFTLVNEDIIKESGINSKKLNQFPDDLHAAVGTTADYKVIAAFGIPGIGPERAKTLLKNYSLKELVAIPTHTGAALMRDESIILDIVGPETAPFAMEFMTSQVFLNDMRVIVPNIKKITKNFDKMFRVGHSGADLSEQVRNLCDEKGFEVTDNKGFDVLIVSSHELSTSKVEIAKKKNLPIYTEEEFMDRYVA